MEDNNEKYFKMDDELDVFDLKEAEDDEDMLLI